MCCGLAHEHLTDINKMENDMAVQICTTVLQNPKRCAMNSVEIENSTAVRNMGERRDFKVDRDAWLTTLHVNNNNSLAVESIDRSDAMTKQEQDTRNKKQETTKETDSKQEQNKYTIWNCKDCVALTQPITKAKNVAAMGVSKLNGPGCPAKTVDNTGGRFSSSLETRLLMTPQKNGFIAYTGPALTFGSITLNKQPLPDCDKTEFDGGAIGAASLTPPALSLSNHTSVNNSTDNFTYSSANYYPDDFIMLEDDDVDAEEISLNSDDCVYAYRGEDADFDLTSNADAARRRGDIVDDETDFLEMDFEPDPLSEVEYGSIENGSHSDNHLKADETPLLSGRHSVTNMAVKATPSQHDFYNSSPIEDLPPPKALQSQSLFSNKQNLRLVSLHLDQITDDGNDDDAGFERILAERKSGMNEYEDGMNLKPASAQSLPNSLHPNFGRDTLENKEIKENLPKKTGTGAKPKCISSFSASSSTSSKNWSPKSRNSLRASVAPLLCNSASFDERSVSCTEFRLMLPPEDDIPNVVPSADEYGLIDEACLDCLENEFIAKTIGKAIDLNGCFRCRRRNTSISQHVRVTGEVSCRSRSPFFAEDDSALFNISNELLNAHKRDGWASSFSTINANTNTKSCIKKAKIKNPDNDHGYQRIKSGEESCQELYLLKNVCLAEKETITISTVNLDEETLVQALEKLHIHYNAEILKAFFEHYAPAATMENKLLKEFKSLKHFITNESKKCWNYRKIKRLIDFATYQQLSMDFKKDTNITDFPMIQVRVSHVLQQWSRTHDLHTLQNLTEPFISTNILGKIANLIRQTKQLGSLQRPQVEFILIPQYYPTGFLTLRKKC